MKINFYFSIFFLYFKFLFYMSVKHLICFNNLCNKKTNTLSFPNLNNVFGIHIICTSILLYTFIFIFQAFLLVLFRQKSTCSIYFHFSIYKEKVENYFLFYSFPLFIQLYLIFEIGILGPSPFPYSPSKILSNSSPSIFSFSINTFATACNLSICSLNIFVALSYPASTIFLTSSSIIAAVSSE